MKTFRCNNCGHELQRPTQPYRCPQCAAQAVGLFKVVQGGQAPPAGAQPAAPGAPPAQPATPPTQPTAPPAETGAPPPQHGGISPVAPPPPPPGVPAPPQGQPPPAVQPAQPPATQPAQPPQQPPPQPARPPVGKPSPAQPTQPTEPPAARPPAQQPQTRAKPPKAGSRARPQRATPPGVKPSRGGVRRPRVAPPTPSPEPPKPKLKLRPQVVRPKEFAWAYPEEPPYTTDATPMRNAPAVDSEGHVFLCSQGRLVALEPQEEGKPKILWEYVTGSHVPGPVVVAPDGSIRVHCSDGFLHCVSSAGKQVWAPAHVGEPLGWAAPVCDEAGNTYVSAYDGGLIRVSPEGKMGAKPYFRSRRKFDSGGIIHQGVLHIGAEDGYVFAIRLDPDRGTKTWNHAVEQGYTGGYVNSSPAMTEEGVLVVAARDEALYGFRPNGSTAWRTTVPGTMLGSPAVDPYGHVYVGVSQAQRGREGRGLLVCVDGNSHKIRWQYAAGGPVESTPAIGDDDTVYFGDNAGTIHSLDTRGNPKWTVRVEAAVRSAGTILAPQRLAFGLDDDTLVVLKCSSQGLAKTGWPKVACTLGQTGMVPWEAAPEPLAAEAETADTQAEQPPDGDVQTENGQAQ